MLIKLKNVNLCFVPNKINCLDNNRNERQDMMLANKDGNGAVWVGFRPALPQPTSFRYPFPKNPFTALPRLLQRVLDPTRLSYYFLNFFLQNNFSYIFLLNYYFNALKNAIFKPCYQFLLICLCVIELSNDSKLPQ